MKGSILMDALAPVINLFWCIEDECERPEDLTLALVMKNPETIQFNLFLKQTLEFTCVIEAPAAVIEPGVAYISWDEFAQLFENDADYNPSKMFTIESFPYLRSVSIAISDSERSHSLYQIGNIPKAPREVAERVYLQNGLDNVIVMTTNWLEIKHKYLNTELMQCQALNVTMFDNYEIGLTNPATNYAQFLEASSIVNFSATLGGVTGIKVAPPGYSKNQQLLIKEANILANQTTHCGKIASYFLDTLAYLGIANRHDSLAIAIQNEEKGFIQFILESGQNYITLPSKMN